MLDHTVWTSVSTATRCPTHILQRTYVFIVQIATHVNAKDSGDVFDVLQDGLDQGQETSLVIPYAEMIDQSLFRLAVTPS